MIKTYLENKKMQKIRKITLTNNNKSSHQELFFVVGVEIQISNSNGIYSQFNTLTSKLKALWLGSRVGLRTQNLKMRFPASQTQSHCCMFVSPAVNYINAQNTHLISK